MAVSTGVLNGESRSFPPALDERAAQYSMLNHVINNLAAPLVNVDEDVMWKVEILIAAVIIVSLSVVYLPDHGVFTKPFKAVWRVLLGVALCYSCFLLYLLINYNRDNAMWDSVLLDVFGCNALGVCLGMLVVRKLGLEEYHWGFSRGGCWSDHRKLLLFLFITIFVEVLDTTLFFIKYELWMPTSHWILVCRTFFWAFFGPPCTTELYKLLYGQLSTFPLYLAVGTIIQCLELGLCIKFGQGVFHESMPSNIRISWAVIWTIVIARVIHLRMEAARKPVNGESVHNERVESPEQRN
ncbi:hypothetical protein Pmar_PMAR012233 [Perkinsus marinus ATCC 50983]|uniref:Transmembrane protein n=1 Tax=Perkinsus marinus (strain ATCC 50983 / TXsc) TaxID=423536 RepID=C5K6V4_PERM5|nr:hypothetical protein Pmar_PMAR012233 [Perkinsus marinus ATCC 50983]EER19789.1 hypothetical protein Pmar_PMAR012233 [Perkinsus marinus ATCC 50983]|eukprot:XP_002787993.1 hypothetical protein Pmar_PMAR012233 [Perkinsus marinus ATCC 50983]